MTNRAFSHTFGHSHTTGILLAGGLSRRYGSPKAFALLSGRPFYEWAYEALRGSCSEVVIAASEALAERFPAELEVCADLPGIAGCGPLAGICTAMRRHPGGRYIVLPCDMPLVGPAEIRRLSEIAHMQKNADVVAVRTAGAHLPLLSVWKRDLSGLLEEAIANGQLGVMKLLDRLPACWIDSALIHEDAAVFRNCNTPDAGMTSRLEKEK